MEERLRLIEHFKTKCSMAIKEAERVADMNNKLVDNMRVRDVVFEFKKIDGTIRKAHGTLREEYLSEIKGSGRPLNFDLQLYYDLEKKSFRSFKKANLISYD